MKVLTAAQMREVDRLTTERCGIPGESLMENAAEAFMEIFRSQVPRIEEWRIAVVCGKGNNGGDGFAIARILAELDAKPAVILCGEPSEIKGDAAASFSRFVKEGGEFTAVRDAAEWNAAKSRVVSANIIIDALLGTGIHGGVDSWLAGVIADMNRCRPAARIFAVDIPSGLSSDSGEIAGAAVEADVTITFTAPKIGQLLYPGSEKVGRLVVGSIGSPLSLVEECSDSHIRWLEPSEFSSIPFRRKAAANKGNFGHALIVAGSLGKTGAAVMAGASALKSGAGLATVAAPDLCVPIISAHLPEIMTAPLPATNAGTISDRSIRDPSFADLLRGKNALAIGPGLTSQPETQEFVRGAIRELAIPIVFDADGLNAFAGRASELSQHRADRIVITPHPGEMSRLLNISTQDVQANRIGVAQKTAKDLHAAVVLKGYQTVIALPDGRTWINSTGNPGMAKGGSGDVLTGMVAGIIAQHANTDWAKSVCLAVYLHGLAGDLAAEEFGEISLMASDIINAIPDAYQKLIDEIEHAGS